MSCQCQCLCQKIILVSLHLKTCLKNMLMIVCKLITCEWKLIKIWRWFDTTPTLTYIFFNCAVQIDWGIKKYLNILQRQKHLFSCKNRNIIYRIDFDANHKMEKIYQEGMWLFVCLFPVKGGKFWSVLGTHGQWAMKVL